MVCPDFDMCAECEKLATHPIDHPLIKLRVELKTLPNRLMRTIRKADRPRGRKGVHEPSPEQLAAKAEKYELKKLEKALKKSLKETKDKKASKKARKELEKQDKTSKKKSKKSKKSKKKSQKGERLEESPVLVGLPHPASQSDPSFHSVSLSSPSPPESLSTTSASPSSPLPAPTCSFTPSSPPRSCSAIPSVLSSPSSVTVPSSSPLSSPHETKLEPKAKVEPEKEGKIEGNEKPTSVLSVSQGSDGVESVSAVRAAPATPTRGAVVIPVALPVQLPGNRLKPELEAKLQALESMGFTDRQHNCLLLQRHKGDLERVVEALL